MTYLPAILLGPEKTAPPSVLIPRSATARLISSRLVGVASERMWKNMVTTRPLERVPVMPAGEKGELITEKMQQITHKNTGK